MPPETPDSQNPDNQQSKSPEEQLGNMVNAAVSAHIKRFTEKQLPALLAEALKPINEKLAAPPPPPEGDDAKAKKSSKQDPEVLAMAKQIEDMKRALEEKEQRAAAAEKKARDERAYTELRASLEGKVRPELLDVVAENLFYVKKSVDFDDAGNPLFKSSRSPYAGAEPEEVRLPLRVGVEDFLKSDGAKAFLPAPSAGAGAAPLPKRGSTPPSGGTDFTKPATSDAEKARRAAERERIAQQRLNQQ